MHLTYQKEDGNKVADRPLQANEATEEMLWAGWRALADTGADLNESRECPRMILQTVYAAMEAVRLGLSAGVPQEERSSLGSLDEGSPPRTGYE